MARVFPFQPYRYSPEAGRLEDLVTQPYDKITPEMQARYLSLSPYNAVHVTLGPRFDSDTDSNNVYTRAAQHLNDWIAKGILAREVQPALFAYFQQFEMPESGERLVRKGFIGLGAVVDYSSGVVHRHEQTLSAPKKDRLELLRHTRAHFGQIFMLYPDPSGEIDRQLDRVAKAPPLADVKDEYGATHLLWKISEAGQIQRIQQLMSDKKLLIADGHHRYETALAFRNENPGLAGADKVMMTFVNMHSPGLKILPTHRVIYGLPEFDQQRFLLRAELRFGVEPLGSIQALKQKLAEPPAGKNRIGAITGGNVYLLESKYETADLDVRVLHRDLLEGVLNISEEAIRNQQHIRYIRGIDAAADELRKGNAQIAFLLRPAPIEQVAGISFAGGVMPQKSTDFYPKLLSGLTIYKVGE